MNDLDDRLRAFQDLDVPRPSELTTLKRRTTRRRTRRFASAAAAAILVAVGTATFWLDRDDTTRVDVIDGPTTTSMVTTSTTVTDETTSSVPDTVPFDPAGYGTMAPPAPTATPPDQFVAVTPDGRLVVVDTGTGNEIRQLAAAGAVDGPPPEEGPGLNYIDSVALSPDGATVWFSECCEPAGGSLYRVPTDGSAAPTRVADGYDPAVPADSRWVAAVSSYGALVVDADGGGPGRIWWNDANSGEHQEVAWSLDGTHIAVRVGVPDAGNLLVVDPATFPPNDGDTQYGNTPPLLVVDGDWRLPTFRRDGRILAANRVAGVWSPLLVDPATGETSPAGFDYRLGVPIDQDVDPTGEWTLLLETSDAASATGTARWIGPDGTGQQIDGTYFAIAW